MAHQWGTPCAAGGLNGVLGGDPRRLVQLVDHGQRDTPASRRDRSAAAHARRRGTARVHPDTKSSRQLGSRAVQHRSSDSPTTPGLAARFARRGRRPTPGSGARIRRRTFARPTRRMGLRRGAARRRHRSASCRGPGRALRAEARPRLAGSRRCARWLAHRHRGTRRRQGRAAPARRRSRRVAGPGLSTDSCSSPTKDPTLSERRAPAGHQEPCRRVHGLLDHERQRAAAVSRADQEPPAIRVGRVAPDDVAVARMPVRRSAARQLLRPMSGPGRTVPLTYDAATGTWGGPPTATPGRRRPVSRAAGGRDAGRPGPASSALRRLRGVSSAALCVALGHPGTHRVSRAARMASSAVIRTSAMTASPARPRPTPARTHGHPRRRAHDRRQAIDVLTTEGLNHYNHAYSHSPRRRHVRRQGPAPSR